MMRARAVSLPTLVASTVSAPIVLSVAPVTLSPGCFSTGRLSPVSMDSSTADEPAWTIPSTGTDSPGRTRTRSPTWTCATGTVSCSPSPRNTVAVLGCNWASRRIASVVLLFARASSKRPSRIRVIITAAVSKYTWGCCPTAIKKPGANTATVL